MNREIKFRYTYSDGKMGIVSRGYTLEEIRDEGKHPDFVLEDITECSCQPIGETNVVECSCDERFAHMAFIRAEQYTGLKDRTGNDVYEGDIVGVKSNSNSDRYVYSFVVLFKDGKFICDYVKAEYGKWGDLSRLSDHDFSDVHFAVIGNIHEHPHLLKTPTNEQ